MRIGGPRGPGGPKAPKKTDGPKKSSGADFKAKVEAAGLVQEEAQRGEEALGDAKEWHRREHKGDRGVSGGCPQPQPPCIRWFTCLTTAGPRLRPKQYQ